MKIRVSLTVQDYYSYVGTNTLRPLTKRVICSLPRELEKGYNMKFKKLKIYGNYYRVHISVEIDDISVISNLENRYKGFCHKPENITWRVIKPIKKVS